MTESLPSPTILIVDDIEANLIALCAVLRQDDLTILQARSGRDALESLLVHDVALALIDLQMPDMDGFELAELMRGVERTRRVPIIFITASAQDVERRFRGYETGAVDFLYKPIEAEILRSKTQVFVDLYRHRQEIICQRDELHRLLEEKSQLLEARNRAEASRRESDERVRLAMTAGAMGSWDMNLATDTVTSDAKEFELLGLSPIEDNPSMTRWYQMVHPDDAAALRLAVQRAIQSGGGLDHEFRVVRPDGSVRWLMRKGAVLHEETGQPARMIGVSFDVTDRKRLEERLRQWNHELECEVSARTQQLGRSQQRLRALAKELTITEQRERKRLANELHDHLAQMLALGRWRLSQIKNIRGPELPPADLIQGLEEVLEESLRYTRTLVTDLSPPVLHNLGLPQALKWLGEYMKRHDVRVTVTIPDSLSHQLPEDQAVLLFQSARELLMNAWKHAGTSEADVTLAERNGELCLTVQDRGKGFDTTAESSGEPHTGPSSKFGLFSIRERMKALGGEFRLESAPGQGTTATLMLPVAGQDAAEVSSPRTEPVEAVAENLEEVAGATDSIRVLLVDDHAMMRHGLRTILENYPDVEVVGEAGNGEEAVSAVDVLQPSVVVMDINMPKLNGIEATARITSRHPCVRVIGLSVNAEEENIRAMTRAGAATLLTKEAAVDQLYQAVKGVIPAQG
ncbi:putative Histidine kinase [Nitrospira sp. KM1]|uniref:response regulator n=1 Tax=Nitrospira sp. KM1 TaxID=1936990 RepID=UPI0013A74285|nr:response regulator [Nitrospira sp. KM1]BCA56055.1 putative Histidine kinase [Nitrospira sp. KM1]